MCFSSGFTYLYSVNHCWYCKLSRSSRIDPPTASQNDFSCDDFKRAVNALVHGGTFKVVSRVLTRDGSILESLQTIFLMRGETNALTAVSTPDTRRLIHLPSELLEPPSLIQSKSQTFSARI